MSVRTRIASGINMVAAALLIAAVTMMTVQVVLRTVFASPMSWVEEVVRYAFVWSVYLGVVVALTHDTHIRVLVLVEQFGPWAKRASDILTWIINVFCFGFLLYWGADLTLKYKNAMFYTLPSVPQMIFYLAVPVSMAIGLAFLLIPGGREPPQEPPQAL
jgi:TRAP-type C4-dicarboxylate transport system permease small subunit